MKKDDEKGGKIASSLYYLSSVCFFILVMLNFSKSNISLAVVFLCLGATFLCFGSVYLKDEGNNEDSKK